MGAAAAHHAQGAAILRLTTVPSRRHRVRGAEQVGDPGPGTVGNNIKFTFCASALWIWGSPFKRAARAVRSAQHRPHGDAWSRWPRGMTPREPSRPPMSLTVRRFLGVLTR